MANTTIKKRDGRERGGTGATARLVSKLGAALKTPRRLFAALGPLSIVLAASLLPNAPLLNFTPAGAAQEEQWGVRTGDAVRLSGPPSPTKISSRATIKDKATLEEAGASVAVLPQGATTLEYRVLSIEFRSAAARQEQFTDKKVSRVAGAHVLTVFGPFADVFVASDEALNALSRRKDVVRIEEINRVIVPPPPEVEELRLESRAVPEKIVRGGVGSLKGGGVTIAVIDTGVDFRHPDFIRYDAARVPTSRLRFLWDTTTNYQPGRGLPGPITYPNRAPVGTLYTREHLNSELRSPEQSIPATDTHGHGTACTSVAAGNGNADRMSGGLKRDAVVGVAPEADIIAVRVGSYGMENAYLLNAICDWLETVADARPLVVSCSFGGHSGGHDGQTVAERQLSARFSPERPGRALIIAAGNDARKPIHAEATFGDGERKLLKWRARRQTYLSAFFDSRDDDIHIAPAGGTTFIGSVEWELNPITGHKVAHLTVPSGSGGLWLYNTANKKVRAHLYFPKMDGQAQPIASFTPDSVSYNTLVAEPGTTENAITVGSYDWDDNFHSAGNWTTLLDVCPRSNGRSSPLEIGKLSCYSSPGPTRAGRRKPEIVAPGEWFTSSYAWLPGEVGVSGWRNVDSTGKYVGMNGTSAATPYVSGVVALMLQRQPQLNGAAIKALLIQGARLSEDPFTGQLPNDSYGHGKLNMRAVQHIFAQLDRDESQRRMPSRPQRQTPSRPRRG